MRFPPASAPTHPGRALLLCAALLGIGVALATHDYQVEPVPEPDTASRDHFSSQTLSPEARHVAEWIADSRDSGGRPFLIVDKKQARVHVFDADARLRGSTAALLGSARGDDSVAGIGDRPIAQVRPEERTTPAGRFIAERGHNTQGEDVIWVDYDAAVSIHRVRSPHGEDRRWQRLVTPTPDDNRISYGCINLPAAFYDAQVRPIFATHRAMVYVLPEVKSAREVFGSYDLAGARHLAAAP